MLETRGQVLRAFTIGEMGPPAPAPRKRAPRAKAIQPEVAYCDWCRRREVGLMGAHPWMQEVVMTKPDGKQQIFHIGPDCSRKLERLISRLERRESPGAIR